MKNKILIIVALLHTPFNLNAEQSILPGSIDPSFGPDGNGGVTIDFAGDSDQANAVQINPKGEIILAGFRTLAATEDFAVARLTPDGIRDNPFGPNGNGTVTLNVGGAATDICNDMKLDNQGRIVCAGISGTSFAVARFSPEGIVDLPFGGTNTGFNTLPIGTSASANALAFDASQGIIAGGDTTTGGDTNFAIARFTPNGTVDTNFGGTGTGFNTFDFGGTTDICHDIIIQKSGRIICIGETNEGGVVRFALVAFNPDGTRDTNFGPNGDGSATLAIGLSSRAQAVALDNADRIIVVGTGGPAAPFSFAAARFTANGLVDAPFGPNQDGTSIIVFPGSSFSEAFDVGIDPFGRFILGGIVIAGDTLFGIVRLNSNGTQDNTFGPNKNSTNTFDFGGVGINEARSLAIDSNNRIILAGFSGAPNSNFAAARFFGSQLEDCTLAIREKYCFLP